jgi:FixJ family two-component response regulator
VPVEQLSIFIIDDDTGSRESIKVMLEPLGCPVFTFESGEDFLQSLEGFPGAQGCAIIDLRLKGMSGLSVLQSLLNSNPCIIPLLVTAFADVKLVVDAISLGATTVIPKPYRDQDLWDAVSAGLVVSQQRVGERQRTEGLRVKYNRLTSGEQEVLACLLSGDSNKQIAMTCDISSRTVDIRRASILKKMEAKTVVELSWVLAQSGLDINPKTEQ